MTTGSTRTRRVGRSFAVLTLAAAVFGGSALSALPASAAATTPASAITNDPNASNGTLAFYNAAGNVITAGSDLTRLFDYARASTNGRAKATKATAYFAFPDHTQADSNNWFSNIATTAATYPNANNPGPLGSATQPVAKAGPGDANLAALLPTTTQDTTAGYNGILQVRLYDTGVGASQQSVFWASDIYYDASANTWQQVYPTPAAATATTTSLAVNPDASAVAGTNVTLTATVAPTAATGTVQFKDGTTALGSPVAVTNGMATYATSTLSTGAHSFTATFAPADTASYTGSTSAASSYTVTSAPTAPGAPTIGSATAGNAQATVSFTAPASTGGSTISGYTVTSSPGGITATGTASPITVTGLTNGTAYTFTVTATNSVGTSAPSAPTNAVTPSAPTAPGAPTIGSATAGNAQATVSFTAPASTGGSAITGYTVTSSPGGFTATGTASPITVTGLTNGTAYTFTVTATNSVGTSAPSAPTNAVTPSAPTAPGAPTIGSATAGNAQATVSFTAPASTGGSAITGYTVTSSPGGITATGTASPITVTGLTNGTAYTFTVTATNSVGTSAPSAPTNAVTPSAPPVPGAPTGVVATPRDGGASIAFTPPADNGSPVVDYLVTASTGETKAGTGSPIVLTGLSNEVVRTFTVTARNGAGSGPASAPSNGVRFSATTMHLGPQLKGIVAGQPIRLHGQLHGGAIGGRTVTISVRPAHHSASLVKVTTASDGTWTVVLRPVYTSSFSASYAGSASQRASFSDSRTTQVHSAVALSGGASRTTSATATAITGHVSPKASGTRVTLVEIRSGGNVVLGRSTVRSDGTFSIVGRFAKGAHRVVVQEAATPSNLLGTSPRQTVTRS